MRKENRKQYEKIVLNSIFKENSKWEPFGTQHLKGKVTNLYRHDYRITFPDGARVYACVEYDATTNEYQVAYLSRFSKRRGNGFRWLGCLSTVESDYLKID